MDYKEKVIAILNSKELSQEQKEKLEDIFPELAESEDERIRREIITYLSTAEDKELIPYESWLAWLEKQCSQIPANSAKTCKDEQKPVISDDALREGIAHFGITQYQIDNWLKNYVDVEKQGEEKSIDPDTLIQQRVDALADIVAEQNPADKVEPKFDDVEEVNFFDDFRKTDSEVEPKFKERDWVIIDGETLHITNVTEDGYSTEEGGYIPFRCEKDARLWTIQDAKDGDVLTWDDTTCVVLFKNIKNSKCFISYCFANTISFEIGTSHYIEGCHPATKEQRDLLFQKMKEAGYEWDAEKKELKKIDNEIEIPFGAKDSYLQEATYYIPKGFHAEIEGNNVVIKKGEQKSAWSEEDEEEANYIADFIENLIKKEKLVSKKTMIMEEMVVWLRNIKYRYFPQPKQEWSEEDEIALGDALWCCKQAARIAKDENDMGNIWYAENWLKSLKNRYTWKPSKEQMLALNIAIEMEDGDILKSLYQDLLKLKEE